MFSTKLYSLLFHTLRSLYISLFLIGILCSEDTEYWWSSCPTLNMGEYYVYAVHCTSSMAQKTVIQSLQLCVYSISIGDGQNL